MHLLEPGGRKFVWLASPPEEEGADVAISPASSPQKSPAHFVSPGNKIPSGLQSERGKQDNGRCGLKLILTTQICRQSSKVGLDKTVKFNERRFLLLMLWHDPSAQSGRTDGHPPWWLPALRLLAERQLAAAAQLGRSSKWNAHLTPARSDISSRWSSRYWTWCRLG